jgi:penicillin-insensitive murein endopeptidase
MKAVFFILVLLFSGSSAFPQPPDGVESTSLGDYRNGKLVNGWRLPRKGKGFLYFSRFSYYILGNANVNSRVYRTVTGACEDLKTAYPSRKFIIMECANKKGGKMLLHRTHQNGLNVDFMSPLLKKKSRPKYFRGLGIFRYLLNFTDNGKSKINPAVTIDFDAMAAHLLTLDKHARKNGLRIKRVIFKMELKDELFSTEGGKRLASKGITFAQGLSRMVNNAHDDHYHVNFEIIP